MNDRTRGIGRSIVRILAALVLIGGVAALAYGLWHPGMDVRDGRHDRGSNASWLAHGWLGADEWFLNNRKTNELVRYRERRNMQALADKLRRHHITDLFLHLCPAEPTGEVPPVATNQVKEFLTVFQGFRVFPWIGGPNGASVRLHDEKWRRTFVGSARDLTIRYPEFAGVHLNVEPLASGEGNFLALLDELRAALPREKLLSVAAYPPPTRWHPFPEVHWDEAYFREVARRCDQIAVMMYDASQKLPKTYQRLMADWTGEVLQWSGNKPVLLGVPTYNDFGAGYHDPGVENLTNALFGIHRALSKQPLPDNYQGIAIYCEWETTDSEWAYLRNHFLK